MTDSFIVDASTERSWTRAQLRDAAAWLTSVAAELDGEVVLSIVLHDRPLAAAWIVAGLSCGLTVNPINPELSTREIANILARANTRLLVTHAAEPSPSDQVTALDPEQLAPSRLDRQSRGDDQPPLAVTGRLLIFTSGTTGQPKGVQLSAAQLQHNVQTAITSFSHEPGAVAASLLPLFHTFTLVSDVLAMLMCGGRVVLCPKFSLAAIDSIVSAIVEHGVQTFSAVPIILQLLARFAQPLRRSSMRFAIAGAAPLSHELRMAYADALGHPILPCYGLSETTCFATITPPEEVARGHVVRGSVGKPAGLSLHIVDESGCALATGERGEIAMTGPSVLKSGYFGMTAEQWRDHVTPEGWFLTGDIGRVDEAGHVFITGRRKNMVIRGGEKIYLEDVDHEIQRMPTVSDSASLAISGRGSDQDLGVVFVVAAREPDTLIASIRGRVKDALGVKSVPDEIYLVDAIPRSPTGKVQVEVLRALRESMP